MRRYSWLVAFAALGLEVSAFLPHIGPTCKASRRLAGREGSVRTNLDLASSGVYDLLGGGKSKVAPKQEFDLLGDSAAKDVPLLAEDPKEALLAEMVFSTQDVRELVLQRLDECDEVFVQFLESKITASTDLDERAALRSLIDIIGAVRVAVQKAAAEEEARAEEIRREKLAEEARVMAELAEARRKAEMESQEQETKLKQKEELQVASPMAQSPEDSVSSMGAEQSYAQLLEAFLSLDYRDSAYVRQVVDANYERCTVEFLDLMGEKLNDPSTPPQTRQRLETLMGHIQAILQERMSRAAERLQVLVKSGSVDEMVDKVYQLAEQGQVDEPLILLLESNLQGAQRAGAAPAAEVFGRLVTAAREALDDKLSSTRRLIRRCLRVDDSEKRKDLLSIAFRPKAQALLADGSKTAAEPEVSPPEFIDELRTLIKNFGNIEADGFGDKLRTLVDEAEEVSVEIYGEPMTVREQQEYMWHKNTMSVFDLEQLESKAAQVGDQMPWQNDKYDAMVPPGFSPDGSRTIGGNRKDAF